MCGAEVPPSARACSECGADDTAGWDEDQARYDGLDLPEDEFDYDKYLYKEFGNAGKLTKKRRPWLGIISLTLVLIALIFVLLK